MEPCASWPAVPKPSKGRAGDGAYAKAIKRIAGRARPARQMVNQICIAGVVQGLAEAVHSPKAAEWTDAVLEAIQGRGPVLADGKPLEAMVQGIRNSACCRLGCARTWAGARWARRQWRGLA